MKIQMAIALSGTSERLIISFAALQCCPNAEGKCGSSAAESPGAKAVTLNGGIDHAGRALC